MSEALNLYIYIYDLLVIERPVAAHFLLLLLKSSLHMAAQPSRVLGSVWKDEQTGTAKASMYGKTAGKIPVLAH